MNVEEIKEGLKEISKRRSVKKNTQEPTNKEPQTIGVKLQKHVEVIAKRVEEKNDPKSREIASAVLPGGTIIEMLYDQDKEKTSLAVYKNGKIEIEKSVIHNGITLKPHDAKKDLLRNKVILLPSAPVEYGSREKLITEVQELIHKYLSVSSFFEKISSYYVLFSWIYDDFNELPYLRVLGDYGTGKSRFLQVVGSICYRPIFTGGATTVSPIFRTLEEFGGTFVLDEADYKISNTTADIVKILNSGFMKNMPVLRSETSTKKSFDVKSFKVFGPKIVATRYLYDDSALESRMITEDMSLISKRDDISCNISDSFWDEALHLRNKLLMFRFREKGKHKLDQALNNPRIEPRLNQISLPLKSIIDNPEDLKEMDEFLEEYNEKLKNDRTLSYQYQVLEAVCKVLDAGTIKPTIGDITNEYNKELDWKEQVKPRKMGFFIGKMLNLRTERNYRGFYLSMERNNLEKIKKLRKRFGIPDGLFPSSDSLDKVEAEPYEHYEL